MKNTTLVIMAAGIGSRFGGGIKQLEPVGPNGEIIMDYSIHDALEAGFNRVVFVIRKNLERDFKEIIGNRIEKIVDVAYAYQEIDDIPEEFKERWQNRTKPWGTGQAILCCKDVVKEPFLVINADDYYGKEAYKAIYEYLAKEQETKTKEGGLAELSICMAGFVLKNTLSSNGTVTRGICSVDDNSMLTDIEETYDIVESAGCAAAQRGGKKIEIPLEASVSMNMWGLPVEFLSKLECRFAKFLSELDEQDLKKEYLLPQIIGEMVRNKKAKVKVLPSHDKWFGVTYKEDKAAVAAAIRSLIDKGEYPEKLFGK
ncbi:MAG: nucleotidyltransferase [Dorea sp.]|nr:nucleotidyltransferase [Dorea sp.]